jgi:hypothetical protein
MHPIHILTVVLEAFGVSLLILFLPSKSTVSWRANMHYIGKRDLADGSAPLTDVSDARDISKCRRPFKFLPHPLNQ